MSKNKDSPVLVELTTIPETAWAFFRGRLAFFKQAGFEVYLVSSPGDMMDEIAKRESIRVVPLSMTRRISPAKDLLCLYRLYRILRILKPTILNSHTPKAGLLGIFAATLARVPIRFFTLHGIQIEAKGIRKWTMRMVDVLASRLAHQTLCVSKSVQEMAIANKIARADRIKVLHNGSINGIDAAYFDQKKFPEASRNKLRAQLGIPDSALVIGYVGRIVRDKGMIELAETWQILREEFPEVHLLLVGYFENEDPVPQYVRKLFETAPCIHITGYVKEVNEWYSIIDIVVLPTYREGFPYASLEGQAMRLPVITTDVSGARDSIIDQVTGILIPSKNTPALTDAIRKLVRDKGLREKLGRAGRERVVADFRPEDIWEELYQEYDKLMAMKRISPNIPLRKKQKISASNAVDS
jgi:glycosyltransferase involved in cell wall biosynthesis